ncbi:MAG: zinc dependent phospholipase C family protein [Mogibacterium diversum]|nr:zinc dependent phospholipase C family protein [Mogibacterium diversum]
MPAHNAHYLFGRTVLRKLPSDTERLINTNADSYAAFIFGLQGPDILAFYRPIFPSILNKEGATIHHSPGSYFFKNAFKVVQEFPTVEKISYLYGAMCHYILDSLCHPIINNYVKTTGMSHSLVEREFDHYVLEQHDLTPFTVELKLVAPVRKNLGSIMAPFYETPTASQMQLATRDMRRSILILGTKNDFLRKRLLSILASNRVTMKQCDMVASNEYDPRSAESNAEIWKKYEIAIDKAVSEIEYIRKSLIDHDQPDLSRYELDYLGKKH